MHRYSKEDESDSSNSSHNDLDPFGDDDFSLDLQMTDKFGKRTGKLYQPQKWKQNSEGFFDFEIESNETLTPESKMDKIRFILGLQTFPNQSSQKQWSPEEFISRPGIKSTVPQNKDRNKTKETNKPEKFSRKSDLSLSFSVELDSQILDNIDEAETSQSDYLPRMKTKSEEKMQLRNKGMNIIDEQQFLLGLKQSKSKQKRKQESQQTRNSKQQKGSGKNIKQRIQSQNQNQSKDERKSQNIKSGEQVKNKNTKKQKASKNRFTLFQKEKQQIYEDKVFQPDVELGEMPSNFQERSSFKKHFKDLSQIRTNYNNADQSLDSNQSLRSFLNVIQNQPSYSQTGQLNRAVINIQSDNIHSDNIDKDSKQQELQEKELANHNKHNQQQQNKPERFISKKNYQEEKSQNITSSEQIWTPLQLQQPQKINLQNKEKKQSYFLSESLRKQAAQYYEQEARMARENQTKLVKQAEAKKFSKRERNFQTVQTNDILNYEKLQQLKEKTEHQKAFKKIKENEPINREEQAKNKSNQPENLKQVFSKNREDNDSRKQLQNSFDEDKNKQGGGFFQKQDQEQKIRLNNRLVKEADKNLNRKQKPQRASPSIKGKTQKSDKSNSQSRAKSLKPKKLSRTKTQAKPENIIDPNTSQIQTNSEIKHKYPQRNRFPKMQYWKGQKVIYDKEGKAKNMQTKELVKLIGLMEQTLVGQLQLEPAMFKGDRYIQVVTLDEKQTIDFSGFDERYSILYIELKKKPKSNNQQLGKYVEVYQGGKLNKINDRLLIKPKTGNFSIQNISDKPLSIQFTLIKNNAWKK